MTRVTVELKPTDVIFKRIFNDKVGIFLAETWAKQFKKYVPADTKALMNSYTTEPYKITYNQKYAHYQWQGVSKSGKPLNYSKDVNPFAGSHWNVRAEKEQAKQVADAVSEYIRRGI